MSNQSEPNLKQEFMKDFQQAQKDFPTMGKIFLIGNFFGKNAFVNVAKFQHFNLKFGMAVTIFETYEYALQKT